MPPLTLGPSLLASLAAVVDSPHTAVSIAVAILGIGFLIFVHELGHFLACKATRDPPAKPPAPSAAPVAAAATGDNEPIKHPLLIAAKAGDEQQVKQQLAAGANPALQGGSRSAIVLAGASGQALAFGPGHVARTPAAGEPGTAIYSGHRDTHFAFLGDVAVGDEIRVTRRDGRELRFRVTGTSVVRWDASGIDPHETAGGWRWSPAGRSTARSPGRCATSCTRS